jgi:hypothetical protein
MRGIKIPQKAGVRWYLGSSDAFRDGGVFGRSDVFSFTEVFGLAAVFDLTGVFGLTYVQSFQTETSLHLPDWYKVY